MDAYENPTHNGNSAEYHTGKSCITIDCEKPAGTMWGPHWCFECNVKRIKRITMQLETILTEFPNGSGP